jgi:phage host-nuclease inhibitor protein Gam
MNDTARDCLQATIKKIEGAYAPSTIRAYRSNFENFIKFCEEINEEALPASSEIVVSFIKSISGWKIKVCKYKNGCGFHCKHPQT